MIDRIKLKIITIYNSKKLLFNILGVLLLVALFFIILRSRKETSNPDEKVVKNTPPSNSIKEEQIWTKVNI
jgi:hypothetical protein